LRTDGVKQHGEAESGSTAHIKNAVARLQLELGNRQAPKCHGALRAGIVMGCELPIVVRAGVWRHIESSKVNLAHIVGLHRHEQRAVVELKRNLLAYR